MRQSITWGAIVGVALGATITFALARGWLDMPWSGAESQANPASVSIDDALPGAHVPDAPVARPLRPGSLPVGDLAAAAHLSRS